MKSPLGPFWGIRLLGVFLAAAPLAQAQNLSYLSDYSVVVSGNFSTNSDVEGRTLVGGNLTGQNSSNFGIKLQGKVERDDLVLRVGGNIASGNPLNVNAGSVELGGSLSGRKINFNGGGSLVSNPGADYSAIIDDLTLASTLLSKLGPNSNVLMPAQQPAAFTFNAKPDDQGLAVFAIDGADLFSNRLVQQTQFNANGATDILINVAGSSISWQHGNLVGLFNDSDWRGRIVWNFYEAESLDFGSKNMMGQVLAPNATITAAGVIDGSVFAANLKTTSEVHLPGYHGNLIPEPGSAVLSLFSVVMLVLRRRRSQ